MTITSDAWRAPTRFSNCFALSAFGTYDESTLRGKPRRFKMFTSRTLLASILGLAAFAAGAQDGGITILTTTSSGVFEQKQLTVVAPDNGTLTQTVGADTGTGVISFNPVPSLYAEASVTAPPGDVESHRVDVRMSETYFFYLVGPSFNDLLVPIGFTGVSTTTSTSPAGSSSTGVRIFGTASTYTANFGCGSATGCDGGSFAGTVYLRPGDMGTVILNADVVALSQNGSASGTAFIDPYFFIDPAFAALHPEYSLSIPNVGNVTPVPEPETYALILAGLAMIGALRRRASRRGVLRLYDPT